MKKNVEIIPKGCGEKAGPLVFKVPLQKSGAISAGMAYISSRNDDHEGKETQVRWKGTKEILGEVISLDEFLLPRLSELTFMKCDTEGSELFIFRGAQKIMDRFHPTVLCEINPWFLQGFGIRLSELLDFFFQRDYKFYRYHRANGTLPHLYEMDPNGVVEDNYFFIHPRFKDRFSSLEAQ